MVEDFTERTKVVGRRIDGRQGREQRRGIDIAPLFTLPAAYSALHATLRVKHFAGFADAGRGMGFLLSVGGNGRET